MCRPALALILSVLLAVRPASAGDYAALDETNFQTSVLDSPHVWILKFGSKKCSSCAAFEPTFAEFTASLGGGYHVGQVNIDEREGMALARRLGILQHGIPGVFLVGDEGADAEPVKLMAGDMGDAAELRAELEDAFTPEHRDASGAFTRGPLPDGGPTGSKPAPSITVNGVRSDNIVGENAPPPEIPADVRRTRGGGSDAPPAADTRASDESVLSRIRESVERGEISKEDYLEVEAQLQRRRAAMDQETAEGAAASESTPVLDDLSGLGDALGGGDADAARAILEEVQRAFDDASFDDASSENVEAEGGARPPAAAASDAAASDDGPRCTSPGGAAEPHLALARAALREAALETLTEIRVAQRRLSLAFESAEAGKPKGALEHLEGARSFLMNAQEAVADRFDTINETLDIAVDACARL
jgi:hypothetical protein